MGSSTRRVLVGVSGHIGRCRRGPHKASAEIRAECSRRCRLFAVRCTGPFASLRFAGSETKKTMCEDLLKNREQLPERVIESWLEPVKTLSETFWVYAEKGAAASPPTRSPVYGLAHDSD